MNEIYALHYYKINPINDVNFNNFSNNYYYYIWSLKN
jgi:hypothetical protein